MSALHAPWPRRDAAHLMVSSAQMAAIEADLFAHGLPVEALMEKAALAISAALLDAPSLLESGVTVLVGPGHNGGDGLVVARELWLAGVPVRVWNPFERPKPLTARHLECALWMGIEPLSVAPDPAEAALWIDALFGMGQSRPLDDSLEELLAERQCRRPGRLVALDVPSGLCSDSGQLLGRVAACARITYCLGLLKLGLVQDPALAWVGELRRLDLGLPERLFEALPPEQPLALAAADRRGAPSPRLGPEQAKYGRGRLLVVCGSERYRGAAPLALLGASASGCGSLRAALPEAVAEGLWAVQPHVVVEQALACAHDGHLQLGALAVPGILERLDAVLLGPGIGTGAKASGLERGFSNAAAKEEGAWVALQVFSGLLVLDADGLNRLAQRTSGAAVDWLQGRQGPTWLTPHRGEFARLFPALAERPPLAAAAEAAATSGATVLLKGARTVVASPLGHRWQLIEAEAVSARAGLGDVLAGYAAGRGAMALAGGMADADACTGAEGVAARGAAASFSALLAAIALDHAQAGRRTACEEGAGACTPMAVAATLGRHRVDDGLLG
ncbi:NAD(P)H-hydrate epimerase [Cyanobium sp. Morenito 9A2]|uniref:NAD(P)H-hydrate epimerase n=1 Tax=Cyanobium sp. Morenito 9A2 TaxID=2823718 RepID=UPI0020CF56E4|nr:NAD(P)H-hydrate epimerase [Cyanobium sp. Morenito 9A2]MCP9849730.1 NAD(P)H-hydrate epimerase [Cyanobium sp. Morenito 9A2]